jgi:hypothetical protein
VQEKQDVADSSLCPSIHLPGTARHSVDYTRSSRFCNRNRAIGRSPVYYEKLLRLGLG